MPAETTHAAATANHLTFIGKSPFFRLEQRVLVVNAAKK
jgi:hypothetical protein